MVTRGDGTAAWLLLLCLVLSLLGRVESRYPIPKPECDTSETWFRHRRSFLYNYEATVEAGFSGTSDVITGSRLSCNVMVNVPKRCEVTVQLSKCKLEERGLDGKLSLSPNSRKLAKLLQRGNEVYMQMDKGLVTMQGKVLVDEEEPAFITNIKRAIVSQIQLPIMHSKDYDQPLVQHDQFGDCPMEVTFDGKTSSIWTRRDVSQCSLPQVFGRQQSMLSFAKQFQLQFLHRPIDEVLYPFESKVDCQYKIGKMRIMRSKCHHGQTFKPITFDGELRAATAVNVTQSLALQSTAKLSKRKSVSRSLNGRKLVPLMMDLQVAPPQDVTSSRLHEILDEIITASSAQPSDNLAPEKFRFFVDLARDAEAEALGQAVNDLLLCRTDSGCQLRPSLENVEPKVLQKRRESFFADGMLSCGTEACVATYLRCVQEGVVSRVEAELSLFNMALFYQPAPAVLTNLLALCQTSKTSNTNCWLTLGTMVHRLAHSLLEAQDGDPSKLQQEGKKAIRQALAHVRAMLGDTCKPGILAQTPFPLQQQKMVPTLLALKILANTGEVIQDFNAELMSDVLQCVSNPTLPDHMATAALRVLNKAELKKTVHTALITLLADSTRPVALRTMAFDRLLRHQDVSTVHKLRDILLKEKLSSLRMYMVTRVGHLLEANAPDAYSLRVLWRSALERTPLPELEQIKGRGSEYAEFSRYVQLPLSKDQMGAKLGISVVFEPSSLVPSQLRVSVSFLLFNYSLDLLDLGLDVQGFENIVRELLGHGFYLKEDLGTTIARLMQAMLPRMGETRTLFFHDKKVVEALQKLFVKINMPTGDTVQAHFHVKVFGNEVGYIELQDIIRMVRGQPSGSKQQTPITSLIKQLAQGLQFFVGKSSKLVEVVRMFPTVAGLPWRAEVHGTMVASATLKAGGDVGKFMSRKGPLKTTGGLDTSVGVRVMCEETVAIGDMTSSGVRLNISVLVNGGLEGRMKYAPRPESKNGPAAQVLEMGLGALKNPVTFISVRSDIYQLHNGREKEILTPRTQVPVKMCVSDFAQTWGGQQLCVEGFYQHVPFLPTNPMPFVSGPVHLDFTSRSVDRSLKEYTASFFLTRQRKKGQPGMEIIVGANFSAPGEKMKRKFDVAFSVNPATKAVHGRAAVPEFGLRYNLDFNSTFAKQGRSSHHLFSSILTVGPDVMHSFIVETLDDKGAEAAQTAMSPGPRRKKKAIQVPLPSLDSAQGMLLKVNVSLPGVSLQVLTNSSSGTKPGLFTQGLYVRYYCEPELGILYALHGQPAQAGARGHVSEWSVSNVAVLKGKSFAQTWRARDTMKILAPGHNVTLTNQMTANYTWASRSTKIYWTSGLGTKNVTTDVITMDAEVRNNSVGRHNDLHYVMQLEHEDRYDVVLDGSLVGVLADMDFKTKVVYNAKAKKRERRSLRSITNRLKRMEESVEDAMETVEEMVVRRGAELTEMFIKWIAGEPAQQPTDQSGKGKAGKAAKVSAQQKTPGVSSVASADHLSVASIVQVFRRPSWKMDIDANLKFKPKMMEEIPKLLGYDLELDLNVNLPHLKKDLLNFNGTLIRLHMYDVSTDWRLHSDVMNFTFDYTLKQKIDYPKIFHSHRWNLVEFTKHRYDRSFSFLMDLERHDHFVYHVHLVSPRTNLSHAINFSTPSPRLRTVRSTLDMHNEHPTFDIEYRETSNLTPKGLKTDVSLNSTWLDLVLDMDIDWAIPGILLATKRLDALGKVPFLQGPSHLQVKLKMDRRPRRTKPPSLTVSRNNSAGEVTTMVGQMLDKDLVFFTFTAKKPGAKKPVTLLNWYIRLLTPTSLQHSLSWEPYMTKKLFNGIYSFYRTGAHTFLLFGETVADNVYKNITDMVVPFTNKTISQVVDRVIQGQMRKVARAGLDPKKNVPVMAKVMKGGLDGLQSLQLSWQNSKIGRLTYAIGVHKAVSTAAWLSTRLHYMVVQDPPFPLKQYIKFRMMPNIRAIAATQQFNFTVPLPFVWKQYLSRPIPRMLIRQKNRRVEVMARVSQAEFPFMAIVSRDKIQTFDGLTYDITVPQKSKCTYLLGTDLVVSNRSLLLTHHSAALIGRNTSVSVAWDGGVTINHNKHIVSHLPAKLSDDHATVTLTHGQLEAWVDGQMRMTYDPESKIYVMEMARHLHNRSLGLLGTTTRDSGDDFRLPSGQVLANSSGFQIKYELSGHAACKKAQSIASSSACDDKHGQLCRDLFQDSLSSPLAPCFTTVDSDHFLELCLRRTCQVIPPKPANACPVVSTYVKLCASRGQQVKVDTKTFRNTCDGCRPGKRSNSDPVDVVFGSAVNSSDRSLTEVMNVINNMAGYLSQRARFGLVHSHEQHVHAHLFVGELLVEAKKLKEKALSKSKDKGHVGSPQVREVLDIAANYPFRPGARRFVVLFTGDNTPEVQNGTWLQQRLQGADLTLIDVSTHLDFQRILTATWDNKHVMCRGCNKNKVSIATTETGKLAAATRGMWMSFDALRKGRRARMRKLMRPFDYIASQPSPQCARGA